ncbi:MAG TPA: 50S ribosomal protein L4 [Gemmataceae bacterium]|nr:50S ribosomal protein L4 [Gemmataceae bacterium]
MATNDASNGGTLSLTVLDRQGKSTGTITVDPADFGSKVSKQLLHDAVVMYLANKRAGTHSTLRRGEVAGSTKKLFRQKGTGNARVGSKRNNKRRGGGTTKGPKPRDYSYRMPKKAVRAATRMAVLSRLQDNEVVIVDDLAFDAPKTKEMATVLKALNLGGTTCLIGTAGSQPGVYKSARNIRGVEILPAAEFNAYSVLRPKKLLLTRAALDELRTLAKKTLPTKSQPARA